VPVDLSVDGLQQDQVGPVEAAREEAKGNRNHQVVVPIGDTDHEVFERFLGHHIVREPEEEDRKCVEDEFVGIPIELREVPGLWQHKHIVVVNGGEPLSLDKALTVEVEVVEAHC